MNDFQKIKDALLKSVGWKYGAQCMSSDRAFDHLWNSYIDLLDKLSERDRAESVDRIAQDNGERRAEDKW